MRRFQTRFLAEARDFLKSLDKKSAAKLLYVIDLAEQINDPKLFKKVSNDIWEFRSRYGGKQIRLLAFWDKSGDQDTLVIATHGFIKKTQKIPSQEMKRAQSLRQAYFDNKTKK